MSNIFSSFFKNIDKQILILVLLLFFISEFTVYSASGGNFNIVISQSVNFFLSFIVMWFFANIPLQYLERLSFPLYLLGIFLLLVVLLWGEIINGARRWIDFGFFSFQPSELMKISLPLMLSWYFARYESVLSFFNYVFAFFLLLIPVVLIILQPDLGTSILVAASGFFVLVLAGLSFKIILSSFALTIISIPFLWNYFLHDYQKLRILTLLDPSKDPLGAGYHIIQSSIAIGSGGVFGKGWLNGTQSQLDFLPERTTDFIFAVYGEEFGLFGNVILILIYLVLIGRGLVIAASSPQ